MKQNKYAVWVLAAVFLVCGLSADSFPMVSRNMFIRGILISQETGDNWKVGLFCLQPGSEADAAEAASTVKLVWGTGTEPEKAFRSAEEKLEGEANYKLCDLLAVCGNTSLDALRRVAEITAESETGRLSERVLYCRSPLEPLQSETVDAAELYEALENENADAPRLYQAENPYLLIPAVAIQGEKINGQGAACVTETAVEQLTPNEAEYAWLLQNGRRTLTLAMDGHILQIYAAAGIGVERQMDTVILSGLTSGLPSGKPAEIHEMDKAEQLILTSLERAERKLAGENIDLLDREKYHKMKFGDASVPEEIRFQIQLYALP